MKIVRCKHCLKKATEKCDICDGMICIDHGNFHEEGVVRCDSCQAKLEAKTKEQFLGPGFDE